MSDAILEKLVGEYGLLAVVLLYFMWYNKEVLTTHKEAINSLVEEMKMIRNDVLELKHKLGS